MGQRPWPKPGEMLFTEEDTEAVLERQREKALACPGCGYPRDESMAKDHHDHYTTRIIRCHACAARERKEAAYRKKFPDAPGTYFVPVEIDT